MNKTIIVTVILIILAGFLFWGFQAGGFEKIFKGPVQATVMPQGIVLFYGAECPHCKIVEDFLVQNKVDEKLKITRLETWHDESNALLLISTAQSCKVDVSQGAPVPLLWDGSKCYVGQDEAINFFKNEAGIQ